MENWYHKLHLNHAKSSHQKSPNRQLAEFSQSALTKVAGGQILSEKMVSQASFE